MSTRSIYLFPVISTAFFAAIFILQTHGFSGLAFDRGWIDVGQYWRILTGNWVHTQFTHFVMNMVGLWLVWFLFFPRFQTQQWFLSSLLISLGVGVGVYFLNPEAQHYVGFSGVLKGLFVLGALREVEVRKKTGLILMTMFVGLMILEWVRGGLPGTSDFLDGKPAIYAHACGAVGGVLVYFILKRVQKR